MVRLDCLNFFKKFNIVVVLVATSILLEFHVKSIVNGSKLDDGFPENAKCEKDETSCNVDLKFVQLNSSYSDEVVLWLEHFEDMPDECRKDICENGTSKNETIGDHHWPKTLMGDRHVQKCKYHYIDRVVTYFPGNVGYKNRIDNENRYNIYRDCVMFYNESEIYSDWVNLNDRSCPRPPYYRQVELIKESRQHLSKGTPCNISVVQARSLYQLLIKYPDDVISMSELFYYPTVLMNASMPCLGRDVTRVSKPIDISDIYNDSLDLLDYAFDLKFRYYWSGSAKEISNIAQTYLNSLIKVLEKLTQNPGNANPNIQSIKPTTTTTTTSRNDVINYFSGKNIEVFFRRSSIKKKQAERTEHVFQRSSNKSIHMLARINASTSNAKSIDIEIKSILFNDIGKNFIARLTGVNKWYMYDLVSPLVYFEAIEKRNTGLAYLEYVEVEFNKGHYFEKVDHEFREPTCKQLEVHSYSRTTRNLGNWDSECTQEIKESESTIKCRCSASGYIGIFIDNQRNSGSAGPGRPGRPGPPGGSGPPRPPIPPNTDLSSFLGFPSLTQLENAGMSFLQKLHIADMVLRSISIAALVVTIISLLCNKNMRKGAATQILVNLCVALICFMLMLFVAERRSNIRKECRVYNVLRYYLALVTLMWNGVEAHNMYRMLVKVFHKHVSFFIRIAALVAWGFPMILLGVIFLIDRKAFNGTFHNCTFKCALKDNTMYYAWLLPMIIIIIHNIVVFIMVLRILWKDDRKFNRDPEKKNLKTRLVGAFTLLVLLGVPWLLSAFGVIKSSEKDDNLMMFQGVVGVIFVVFVSLQGLFIFLFHCVRNQQVRNQWSNVFRRPHKGKPPTSSSSPSSPTSANNENNDSGGTTKSSNY